MPPIPPIPDNAPFSPEQRAWLNGFLSGLFGGDGQAESTDAAPAAAAVPLTVAYGSQTGNSETCARQVAKDATARGMTVTSVELCDLDMAALAATTNLLIITSTYGDGEMPDNAQSFWDSLSADDAPALADLRYSVLALGDMNYADTFCQAGREIDERLTALGATALAARVDCDVDFDDQFDAWRIDCLELLSTGEGPAAAATGSGALFSAVTSSPTTSPAAPASPAPVKHSASSAPRALSFSSPIFSRKNPFPADLIGNVCLNGDDSAKDTRHVSISLAGSDLQYETGDALGVMPANCPELVEHTLAALGASGMEAVPAPDGHAVPLREALQSRYEIGGIPKKLLTTMAEKVGAGSPADFINGAAPNGLDAYLYGRQVVDILEEFPDARPELTDFVGALSPLQPRLYSISSSPHAHPGEVHLTVGVVRYAAHGRERKGVCSTFLADRIDPGLPVPVFVSPNKSFRLPSDPGTPVIMIGPGTGVAPFRAFLEDRRALAASGPNWLFFGDQHEASDFLYRQELQTMLDEKLLTRLDTAFSRDGDEKIYVQHRMQQNAAELYEWLQDGAHLYICGDASRMAKDVDTMLHTIVQEEGGLSTDDAADYVKRLKSEKRYQRDVY